MIYLSVACSIVVDPHGPPWSSIQRTSPSPLLLRSRDGMSARMRAPSLSVRLVLRSGVSEQCRAHGTCGDFSGDVCGVPGFRSDDPLVCSLTPPASLGFSSCRPVLSAGLPVIGRASPADASFAGSPISAAAAGAAGGFFAVLCEARRRLRRAAVLAVLSTVRFLAIGLSIRSSPRRLHRKPGSRGRRSGGTGGGRRQAHDRLHCAHPELGHQQHEKQRQQDRRARYRDQVAGDRPAAARPRRCHKAARRRRTRREQAAGGSSRKCNKTECDSCRSDRPMRRRSADPPGN